MCKKAFNVTTSDWNFLLNFQLTKNLLSKNILSQFELPAYIHICFIFTLSI